MLILRLNIGRRFQIFPAIVSIALKEYSPAPFIPEANIFSVLLIAAVPSSSYIVGKTALS